MSLRFFKRTLHAMTRSETCFRFHDFRATHSRENADFRNHANHLQSAPCRRSSAVEPSLHVAGHVGGCDRRLCSGDAADHHGPCAHCLRRGRMSGQTGRLRRPGRTFRPPRDLPMACGPFFRAPSPSGRTLPLVPSSRGGRCAHGSCSCSASNSRPSTPASAQWGANGAPLATVPGDK